VYAEERQSALADLVARDNRVSVSRAAERFGVTTETVRRDLAVLERQGVIHRVYGGAVAMSSMTTLEPAVAERDVTAAPQKDRIAHAAFDLLPGTGGSIILDGGTTTGRLAALLPVDRPLTVITNAAPIAAIITARTSNASRLELHVLGGRVRPVSQVTVGATALASLDDLRVDVSFIGVNAFSLERGLLTPNHDEAAVKSAMIRAGRRVVVLTDSSKFGQESLVRFGQLQQIDAVVTDDRITDSDARALEALDIDVVIA
jgi:DeoR family fructose operon transcriptional repressor